jgi:hypothetical protein
VFRVSFNSEALSTQAFINESGVQEFDILKYGDHIGTMGELVLYRCPKICRTVTTTTSLEDVKSSMVDITTAAHDYHRQRHLIFFYQGLGMTALALHAVVESDWSLLDVSFFVGVVGEEAMVFIHKTNYKKIPTVIVNDVTPQVYKFPMAYPASKQLTVKMVQLGNAFDTVVSNLYFHHTYQEINIERLQAASTQMSEEQFVTFKGRAECKQWKSRSVVEATFLRVYKTLVDLRYMKTKCSSDLFLNAFEEHPDVVPLEDLINVDFENGERLSDSDHDRKIKYTMRQLFEQPELLLQYGIVILGSNNTSGFGKSSFAKRLALEFCKAYAIKHKIPHRQANVVFASTLDVLKDVKWQLGMIVILDELHPYDREQLVHVSETIMKQVICPSEIASFRGRNTDVKIPKNIPRILTGNVPPEIQGDDTSAIQRWYGSQVTFTPPLARKAIYFVLVDPLCSASFRKESRAAAAADLSASFGIAETMLNAAARIPRSDPNTEDRPWWSRVLGRH